MHNGTFTDNQEYFFGVVTGAMYPLPTDVTPSRTPSPTRAPGSSAAPTPAAAAAAAAAYEKKVDTAAAVFGTLGGLAVAAACVVFFLPTAGFMLAGKLVVPAEYIRAGAGAAWGGVCAMGRCVGGALSGAYAGATSGGGASATALKPAYAAAGGAGGAANEGASLLRSGK
jgi:hypothetical protein